MLLGGAVVAAATAAAGCTYSFIYILAVGYRFSSPLNVCGDGVRVCWSSCNMKKHGQASSSSSTSCGRGSQVGAALRCWFTIWDSPRCPAGLWSSSLWPFCSLALLITFCAVGSLLFVLSVYTQQPTNQKRMSGWRRYAAAANGMFFIDGFLFLFLCFGVRRPKERHSRQPRWIFSSPPRRLWFSIPNSKSVSKFIFRWDLKTNENIYI